MEEDLLRNRLAQVRRETAEAAAQAGYPAPKIIAVTKTHPVEMILPLQGMDQADIGENRVQEIVEKLPVLEGKFRIHLIGRLQSNKVKYIIEHVCLIHSVDRLSLAEEIDRQAQKHGLVMPVLMQVSPAGEPQKGGVAPEEAEELLRQMAKLPGLKVRGIMAVMPKTEDEAWLSGLFAQTRTLFERLREEGIPGVEMEELSMGMSGDYQIAARHGATMVRIGSALFGPRDYGQKV